MAARRFRSTATACVLATLAACSGHNGSTARDTAEPLASLGIIDRDTLVKIGTPDFRDGNDGEPLTTGNTVKTSDTGFAELSYFDGSFTRIDRGAQYTLTQLDNTNNTRTIRATLASGRSWNRIQHTTNNNDTFQIDTPVATATVRGTAFTIDCTPTDQCTFTLIAGTLDITPPGQPTITITAPTQLTITRTTPPTTTQTNPPLPQLTNDPFIQRNLTIDTTKGLPPLTNAAATTVSSSTSAPSTAPPATTAPTTTTPVNYDLAGTWELRFTNYRYLYLTGVAPAFVDEFTAHGKSNFESARNTSRCSSTICFTAVFTRTGERSFSVHDDDTHGLVFDGSPGRPLRCTPPPDTAGLWTATMSADGNTVTFDVLDETCQNGVAALATDTWVLMRVGGS